MSYKKSAISIFSTQLKKTGADFICNTAFPASSVSVLFLGCFHGEEVLWDMTLSTLLSYRAGLTKPLADLEVSAIYPFIEIQEEKVGVYPIHVYLDLPIIDEPSIKKTIIMVRNYKRLRVGKIEFGQAITE